MPVEVPQRGCVSVSQNSNSADKLQPYSSKQTPQNKRMRKDKISAELISKKKKQQQQQKNKQMQEHLYVTYFMVYGLGSRLVSTWFLCIRRPGGYYLFTPKLFIYVAHELKYFIFRHILVYCT